VQDSVGVVDRRLEPKKCEIAFGSVEFSPLPPRNAYVYLLLQTMDYEPGPKKSPVTYE